MTVFLFQHRCLLLALCHKLFPMTCRAVCRCAYEVLMKGAFSVLPSLDRQVTTKAVTALLACATHVRGGHVRTYEHVSLRKCRASTLASEQVRNNHCCWPSAQVVAPTRSHLWGELAAVLRMTRWQLKKAPQANLSSASPFLRCPNSHSFSRRAYISYTTVKMDVNH